MDNRHSITHLNITEVKSLKRRFVLSTGLSAGLSIALLMGCNSSDTKSAPSQVASTSTNVKLGFSAWPGWFPWQVTQEQGIFAANKITVETKWFDNYTDSITALNTNKIDANSQTLGDTISSISGGADLVVVMTNDNSTGNDKIIASDKIKSVADLKGKKVAVEEGTVDHFLLAQGLKKAGLTLKDIQVVPMPTGDAASAFVAGKVDAVAVFAPFTTQALKRPGSKELFSSKDFPGSISDHLVVSRSFLTKHPEKVQAMVDSWFATLEKIKSDPTGTTAIMVKRANVSATEYQEFAQGTKIFTLAENLQAFQPGTNMASLNYAAKFTSDFVIEGGFIKTYPDFTKIFDDRFVKDYASRQQKK
jgi:NitT/TauT family transport system substrate-binding protein